MTNFNFLLNNLSYLSSEDLVGRPMDSTCFRSAPVPPSFRLRLHPLRMVATLLLLLCLGVGEVWGADYNLVSSVGDLSAGDIVVIATAAGKTATTTESTNSSKNAYWFTYVNSTMNGDATKITSLGSGAAEYTLSKSGSNWIFTCSSGYIGSVSDSKLRYGIGTNTWTITISSNNASIASTDAASRIIYFNSDRFRTYTNAQTAVRLYKKASACDKSVTISKGSETNGTFTLSKTGSQATCSGLSVVVTPTPSTHYHVASVTATTPTTGGAPTITGPSDGKYTVAYAANSTGSSTINVAFEEDPQYTVTWVAGGNSSFHTQTSYAGTALTAPGTPDASTYCPGGKVFVGWTATEIVGTTNTQPADLFTSVSGMSIPATNKTYYAVFATSGSSSKTYSFSITASNFNTDSYAANNNQKTTTATATDASGATLSVKWTSNQVMKNGSDIQFQKNAGYVYNDTDLGTVNSVTYTASQGTLTTTYGTSSNPTSGTQGSGKGYFRVKETGNSKAGKTTSIIVNFTKTTTTYSNYATSCCTPLGTINGSFLWSN